MILLIEGLKSIHHYQSLNPTIWKVWKVLQDKNLNSKFPY